MVVTVIDHYIAVQVGLLKPLVGRGKEHEIKGGHTYSSGNHCLHRGRFVQYVIPAEAWTP
jgi:hypothetical protein